MLGNLLPGAEKRAISFQTLFASGDQILFSTNAGVVISEENVLKINAVYACVRLIADSISTLPLDAFQRRNGARLPYRPKPEWIDAPEIGVSRSDYINTMMVSLLLNGNAFAKVVRDERGVVGLICLNPMKVQVERTGDGTRPLYIYDNKTTITHDEMIHVKELVFPGQLRGKSRIDLLKENAGLASALEQYAARWFGQGTSASGVITVPQQLTREQARDLADSFTQEHQGIRKSHRVGVLHGGASFTQTTPDNDSAQFIESRRFAVEDICRAFRVPPSMVGLTIPGAMSYASVESNAISFVTNTLRPYIARLEDAHSRLLPNGVFLKFNVDGLMRGDTQSRYAAYSTGLASGFLSINDVRTREDLSPADNGDQYRVPLANVSLDAAGLAELDRKTTIAQRLIDSGFEPEAVLQMLEMPLISHTGLPSKALQPQQDINPTPSAGTGAVE